MARHFIYAWSLLVVAQAAPSLPEYHLPSASLNKVRTSFRVADIAEDYPTAASAPQPPTLPAADVFVARPITGQPSWKQERATEAVVGSGEANPVDYSTYGGVYDAPVANNNGRDAFVINSEPNVKFLPPVDSVVPKFTGGFVKGAEHGKEDAFVADSDVKGPITNPAAYYLQGANIENVKPPQCKMVGCDGPVPNDNDIFLQQESQLRSNSACHQTFVPLNGCVDGRGYPVGMICTICCDCASDFKAEMMKSRGYVEGYKTK
jgi:hypothetical protein